MDHKPKLSVILPAGGKGSRMGKPINKQYLDLQGMPILTWTWRVFARLPCVFEIILVVASGEENYCCEQVVAPYMQSEPMNNVRVVAGGSERIDSVNQGLKQVSKSCEYVAIHDGARPLITDKVVYRTLDMAVKWGAAIAGVPAKDTIKTVKTSENNSCLSTGDNKNSIKNRDITIDKTLPREQLIQVQTPQIFQRELIMRAYKYGLEQGLAATDDSMLVEALGSDVAFVHGDYHNIKMTTPEDMWVAEKIIEQRGGSQTSYENRTRH